MAWRRHARNMGAAILIGGCGDALMQHQEGASELDSGRTLRLVSFRAVHAPVIDSCWRWFDKRIAVGGALGIAAKIAADQGVLMPPSVIGFFLWQGALEGLSLDGCIERATQSFVPTATFGLPFWCCVHAVTFGVFPPQWRMPWASVCAVGWNALISGQNQAAIRRELKHGSDASN